MLSNARKQPRGIVPVPDPVDSPLCLVDRHFIAPIPGQEGGRRKHPSCITKPKSPPLTGVQYVSVHCVLILVSGYITLIRTTQVKY